MTTQILKWTKEREMLRALSIRQPWAWLIVNGFKDVENRDWSTTYIGPLLIHAGGNRTGIDAEREYVRSIYDIEVPEEMDFGGIVGVVDLAGCKETSRSRWHNDEKIGWILKNPARLPFRVVKGQLKLFTPHYE